MGVCVNCDIYLNRMVGEFFHLPKEMVDRYEEHVRDFT